MKQKVLLIGWDAADWKVIHELMDAGKMPTLQQMVDQGTVGNLRTLNPPLSPMLWTSIATGKRPYKHGIYGFTEPSPHRDGVQAMTNLSRSSKAVWNILNQNDKRSVVLGWWPSHPAEPINGVMVSDFFHKCPKKPHDAWPLRRHCVHPPDRLAEMSEFRVHPLELLPEDILPFVPHGTEIDQANDSRLSMLMRVTAECTSIQAAATHLLKNEAWDFAAVYFDAIDHYSHGFMRYRAPQQAHIPDHDFKMYRHVVDTAYIYHDMMLKQLLEFTDNESTVLLISDHGFHPDHLRPSRVPDEPAGPAKEHRDYGIFVAIGPNIKQNHCIEGANLLDVAPTILTAFGLPVGRDMDGRTLTDIFVEEPCVATIESWERVDGHSGEHPAGFAVSEKESKAALDQLVALGYIDPPTHDSATAVAECKRELDYNLARAYMDADMHGKAAPLLMDLYQKFPLEFRFGIHLAACLRVLGDEENLKRLIQDLNDRWRKASELATERIRELASVARDRRKHWKALRQLEDQESTGDVARIARVDSKGRPILFSDDEKRLIRRLKSIARGHAPLLDFLAATAATAEGNYKKALQLMEQTGLSDSGDSTFHFHLGNIYIALGRYDDAEATMLRGLAADEHHPKCLMGLSRCYLKMGLHEKALEYSRKAIGLQYHFPLAQYYYGLAQEKMGDFGSALNSFHVAIEQNPNFEEAHQALAVLYAGPLANRRLAAEHRSTAKDLARENERAQKEVERFPFDAKTNEALSAHLPSILTTESSPNFEPALNQAIQTATPAREHQKRAQVILVSGLPRSGTSMMMQMLAAGGLDIFTDGRRRPDESNPKGYFETDFAKGLATKNKWLHDCDGQVLKVVSPLVQFLPQSVDYKVIYMRRPITEVVDSQVRMLERLGEAPAQISPEQMGKILRDQAHSAISLLKLHKNPVLRLAYADVLSDPAETAAKINEFLGLQLDQAAMVQAVDPNLYRERAASDSTASSA